MKRPCLLLCLALLPALLAGCGRDDRFERRRFGVDAGWHYRWDRFRNSVSYGFGDASGTHLTGICEDIPVFGLWSGDYGLEVRRFTVTIDGRSRDFEAFQGEHGRGLVFFEPGDADFLASARHRVTFRADDGWTRSLAPGPELARFIAECRSLRKADPDGMGRKPWAPEAPTWADEIRRRPG